MSDPSELPLSQVFDQDHSRKENVLDQVLVRLFTIVASKMGSQPGFVCRRKITLITIERFPANMNLSFSDFP